MKNYIQAGSNISIIAAAAFASGAGVKAGSLFGIAQGAAAIGETVTIARTGVFELPKVEAQAWTVGALIYWDDTAKLATTVTTSNKIIGCAVAAADNPSTVGTVCLDGAAR